MDDLQETICRLVRAGHTVHEEVGPWSPFGLLRINGGPELTQMQFLQVAEDLLPAPTE